MAFEWFYLRAEISDVMFYRLGIKLHIIISLFNRQLKQSRVKYFWRKALSVKLISTCQQQAARQLAQMLSMISENGQIDWGQREKEGEWWTYRIGDTRKGMLNWNSSWLTHGLLSAWTMHGGSLASVLSTVEANITERWESSSLYNF